MKPASLRGAPAATPIITDPRELMDRAKRVGLSARDLAEAADVHPTTVSRIKPEASYPTLKRLTEALVLVERQRLGELMRLHPQQEHAR